MQGTSFGAVDGLRIVSIYISSVGIIRVVRVSNVDLLFCSPECEFF